MQLQSQGSAANMNSSQREQLHPTSLEAHLQIPQEGQMMIPTDNTVSNTMASKCAASHIVIADSTSPEKKNLYRSGEMCGSIIIEDKEKDSPNQNNINVEEKKEFHKEEIKKNNTNTNNMLPPLRVTTRRVTPTPKDRHVWDKANKINISSAAPDELASDSHREKQRESYEENTGGGLALASKKRQSQELPTVSYKNEPTKVPVPERNNFIDPNNSNNNKGTVPKRAKAIEDVVDELSPESNQHNEIKEELDKSLHQSMLAESDNKI